MDKGTWFTIEPCMAKLESRNEIGSRTHGLINWKGIQKAVGFRATAITAEFGIAYLLSGSLGLIDVKMVDLVYLLLLTNLVKTGIYYVYDSMWSRFAVEKIQEGANHERPT